ncbi:hypothetical protein BVX98_00440 [bacterium F11]|nr:hypothetical protein BVX98_00440 [bacterium F11]
MNSIIKESFWGLAIYVGTLCVALCVTKYVFKTSPAVLVMSLSFLILYGAGLLLAPFTVGKSQAILFNLWNILVFVTVITSIAICLKTGVGRPQFLWSLIFQVPYCMTLYYYGGIIFTHKFS